MENNFHSIGKISGSYGKEGRVRFKLYEHRNLLKNRNFLFIKHQNIEVPYRIIKLDLDNSILKFDDIDDQDQAERLVGELIYIPIEESDQVANAKIHPWINFNIFDNTSNQNIGEINEVREMPAHDMAIATFNNQEVMIPLAEELIESVDYENRIITMNLPQGILEL